MLNNLRAEMTRNNILYEDLAKATGRDVKSISNKIACRTEFTRKEMLIIKKTFFSELTMDYLFSQDR